MIICFRCKKEFQKTSNNQKYCSGKCSKIIRQEQKKAYDKLYHKNYYETHKEEVLKYQELTKKHKQEYDKKYKILNRNKRNVYEINRRKNDLKYKILCNLRTRINSALKRNSKKGKTLELLGCDITFLRTYLKNLFAEDMSWNNYGKWEIDHIIPCSFFNLSKQAEQQKCFHYTNLQPLWKKDNLEKRDKINFQGRPCFQP